MKGKTKINIIIIIFIFYFFSSRERLCYNGRNVRPLSVITNHLFRNSNSPDGEIVIRLVEIVIRPGELASFCFGGVLGGFFFTMSLIHFGSFKYCSTHYFPDSCESNPLTYYSGGIRTHDLCCSKVDVLAPDHRDCPIARGSLNYVF